MRPRRARANIPTRMARPRACLAGWLLRCLGAPVARLPQSLLLRLGAALAWATRPLQRRRARIAAINLALCLPTLDTRARARLLRDTLRETTVGLLEMLRAWYAPSPRLAPLYSVEGRAHLEAAQAQGRGVILLTAHFTTLEIAVRLAAETMDVPLTALRRPHNNPCLEAEIDRRRRHHCGPTIDKRDVRGLLAALARNETVVYAADQDFTFQHAFVPFFGVPAATLTTTARLAERSGAVVLPYWCHRDATGHYRLRIDPPWDAWPSGDATADAAHYMAMIEREARTHLPQYLWVHRRFKTRPKGDPPLYTP